MRELPAEVAMTDIEVAASGAVVNATPGDRIVVRLPENASTGYQWSVAELGAAVEIESDELLLPGTQAPGAAGQRVLRLRPRGPGQTRVVLRLQRRWEPEPVDRFEFDVIVPDD